MKMFRNLWKDIQWSLSFGSSGFERMALRFIFLSLEGFKNSGKKNPFLKKGLFITLTLQLLFSLSTWIEYTINLGGEETEGLRVSSNFYFIFFPQVFFSLVRFGALIG
ncbi:hypothetical protein LEP1GSC029_3477 [Leptospira interrogans str. 2002000626]|uniref:Uncharacterized protein n=1 Tax=Leptospira interrogans str. 2002000626 TaxID=996803 RepID=A0A829DDP3_LEPIR|nr:hypothetical protein LEP1GSC029_3477 [Leptospira interrogans str. 2002000626]